MLTRRQKEIHVFLQEYMRQNGIAPTYDEIRRHFGFRSYNSVFKHLKQLENRGFLVTPGKNRKQAFWLTEPIGVTLSSTRLPLLGLVAAGQPVEALQTPDTVEVPESFLGTGEHFALRVRGDSMVEDGIHDGDLILVRQQSHADNGQTVVALIGNEATVKKFFRKGPLVELHPANPQMRPLVLQADEVTIQGVVVGLIRKYA
ncbi:MAG: transcriptional repressor LexA [bacterium]